jgi:formylglycine-generating enzyme required for sulfatase activity
MSLDGMMSNKITEAIKSAFTISQFKMMLFHKMNIREANIPNYPYFEEIILAVVQSLDRQDRIHELIDAALITNPGNSNLKQLAEEYKNTLSGQIPVTQNSSQLKENLGYGVTLEMVAIPSGVFRMGSPKNEKESQEHERPQHSVAIQSFFMGKYLITQKQWEIVAAFLPQVNYELNPNPSRFAGDNQPVEQVSWYEAVEFCDRLSRYSGKQYRLPSEAEWEYACRAGKTTPFYFGEIITIDLANYNGAYTYSNAPKGEYQRRTTPVGSFPPNFFGLYDMHGNLWEWCADTWHGNYQGAPKDGSPWLGNDNHQGRLLRGGSWYTPPEGCRSGYRYKYDPSQGNDRISFRVVCDVMPKP